MKQLIPVLAFLCLTSTAMADQKATIKCTGEKIILTEKSPYLGENSKFAQSLIILQRVAGDESVDTAYFLDPDMEGDADFHFIYSSGKNKKGGKFDLKTGFWERERDETSPGIKEKASGFLTYSHGTLNGKDEPVTCVRE